MIRKSLLLLISIIIVFFAAQSNAQGNIMSNAEPGKCYAKCLIIDKEINSQVKVVVTDSIAPEYRTSLPNRRIRRSGFTEWKEVICEKDINSQLISKIQSALINNGYDKDIIEVNGDMCQNSKANLVEYQKANDLPVGQFDIESLRYLDADIFLGVTENK